ncbi:hypothetical protein DDB_G0283979 [Dictyostelium discoideum AX4]|uniref:G domain-containing protein n=1 Tax=Dictyostelium discoideum TaxID=44689 RepID=Q54QA1_DICDI|nr:hypothetical protein DDB_G0283979 [Dictyostelium discoideum AX4]EAL65477.1 hypothetical protein DDB_G0283979 [Dictyostelium discoideum AX4]|eukprot:XP_638843.1 hypothetical protein DDB_G0283979 [Dictyostelium discoideum AX4]
MVQSTNILSLGRIGSLGEQINLRNEKFLKRNIFEGKIADKIQIESKHNYHITTSTKNISKDIGIDNNLKLSTLVGLIEIDDSSIYSKLLTKPFNKKVISGSLVYKITTSTESIGLNSIKNHWVDSINFQDQETTHVITGIEYGEYVLITLEKTLNDEANKKKSLKELKKILEKISGSIKDNGSIELDYGDDDDDNNNIEYYENLTKEFKFKMIGKIFPNGQVDPTSFTNAIKIMKDIPKLILIRDKSDPIQYEVIPISSIHKQLSIETIGKIDEKELIEDIETEFKSLFELKSQFNDFTDLVEKNKQFLKDNQVQSILSFKDEVYSNETFFKANLKNLVIQVKSGESKVKAIEKLVSDYLNSNHSSKSIKKFLGSHKIYVNDKLLFLEELKEKGIEIISKSMSMQDFVLKNSTNNCKVYILNYYHSTSRSNEEIWNQIYLLTFIHLVNEKRINTKFAIVDIEILVDNDSFSFDPNQTNPYIEFFLNGFKKQSNFIFDSCANYIECIDWKLCRPLGEKPKDTRELKLKCPGEKCFDSIPKAWKCLVCDFFILYSNKRLYCGCGSYSVEECHYKCSNNENHENVGYCLLPKQDKEQLKYLPTRPLVFLLLGESGVGKSTFINSFANYALYDSLDEAIKHKLKILIPVKFSMVVDEGEKLISIGCETKNEYLRIGQSSTQTCQTYEFPELGITIIDTPGIGDSRGIHQDSVNLQHILKYISSFDKIDGICILLKPNESKSTVLYQYCFKGILSQLDKSAANNIAFCYTNSRGTFYKPGDSHLKIQQMVKSLNVPNLKYNGTNTFCFDSESFRLLAALQSNVKFSQNQINDYSSSWKVSVESTEKLISYLNLLPPHDIRNTVSLNECRILINALSKPVVEITRLIDTKLMSIENKKQEIIAQSNDIESLKKNLTMKYFDLERKDLPYPTTVCTNSTCVTPITIKGVVNITYTTQCHVKCLIKGTTNTINCLDLKDCYAMNNTLYCKECKFNCHYSKHMHITYETFLIKKEMENEDVKKQIEEGIDATSLKRQWVESLEKEIKENTDEKNEILKISSQLSYFLKENCITTYHDTVIEYLKICIENEELKSDKSGKKSMEDNLKFFQDQHDYFQKNLSNQQIQKITTKDVPILIEKLKNLKENGKTLRECIEANVNEQLKTGFNPIVVTKNTNHSKEWGFISQAKKLFTFNPLNTSTPSKKYQYY